MDGFAICQSCAGSLAAHLPVPGYARQRPAGCCVLCQSFACLRHGQRERGSQQFRCIECIPAVLLYNAVAGSGSENELAKAIIARRQNEGRAAFEIRDPNSFLEEHELVREQSRETLSAFHHRSEFDLFRAELVQPGLEKAVRDLRRMQFRLESTPQRDILKVAASYLAFMYPIECQTALPADMEVLRRSFFSSPAGTLDPVDNLPLLVI